MLFLKKGLGNFIALKLVLSFFNQLLQQKMINLLIELECFNKQKMLFS